MSAVEESDKAMLAYYREAFPKVKADNEQLRKENSELRNLIEELRHKVRTTIETWRKT